MTFLLRRQSSHIPAVVSGPREKEEPCMKKEKTNIKLNGKLAVYFNWPVYLLIIILCFDITMCLFFPATIPFVLLYTLLYSAVCILVAIFKKHDAVTELVLFAAEFSRAEHQMLKELDVPFGLLDLNGNLIWSNNDLKDLIAIDKWQNVPITKIFNNDTLTVMPTVEEDVNMHITYGRSNYLLRLRLVTPSEYGDMVLWKYENLPDAPEDSLVALFLYDETESVSLNRRDFDDKLITGLIYIDNFDEAFEKADDARRSIATAWVEREINKYMKPYDAIVRKLEKDRYLFITKQKHLLQMESNRFQILENIRNLNIYDLSLTVSVGVGAITDSYKASYETAHAAIDLAMGRGGDQAVVKRAAGVTYFGGTTQAQEKSTRVKARVKAEALCEYIEAKEKVVVMGHSMADIDSVGASVGIYRIAKALNKRAYICITDPTLQIKQTIDRFAADPEYEEDMFITGANAKTVVDNETLLVVVDVNRPTFTDTPELLKLTETVIVFDHHRQMSDKIEDTVLAYIEPFISSTCEMIAEMLQYVENGLKLKPPEADVMYGGIMIDTNNFLVKAGVRTFEAAAFLRRNGADITRIRKNFRSNYNEYKVRAEAVSGAEIFMEHFIFAKSNSEGLESPTIVAAQVADELLGINGIRGAFVFTEYNDKIYVSARSIDELNVQVLTEKLGGGGHMSSAGVQFENITIDEAIEKVKQVIVQMKENKEIK